MALLAALVVSSLIIVAIPIARIQANTSTPDEPLSAESGRSTVVAATKGAVVGLLSDTAPAAGEVDTLRVASVPRSEIVPSGLLEAAAKAVIGNLVGPEDAEPSVIIERRDEGTFTLHEDGFVTTQVSAEPTVGRAISALGIALAQHDSVWPSRTTPLIPGAHVYVRHATGIRMMVANVEREYFTQARTIAELLRETGIGYEPTDRVFPRPETAIRNGLQVHITTIRNVSEVTEETLDFDTVYRYDADRPDGETVLVQAGNSGAIRREYRVRLINGIEVKREFVTESVSLPTDQIVTVGTYVAPAPTATARPFVGLPPGADACAQTLNVYATWYTAASAGGSGTTATGTGVYKGIVAVDPRVIPLGTRMYIPGYGYGLAADTGGGIRGYMIDLGYGANDVYDWRTRWIDICILP